MNKQCSKCGIKKDITKFYIDKTRKDGLYPQCKKCKCAETQKWKQDNSEKYRQIRQRYLQQMKNNPDFLEKNRQRTRRFLKNNPDYKRKYEFSRYHGDIGYRLVTNLRSRLRDAIKNNTKSGRILTYLGCSVDEFKKHLESQFVEGMTWDNYGNKENCWSIDHIIPCASFDFSVEENIFKCCHYSNLQPMWHIENIKKRNKLN